jgi:hypothetical protein
MRRLYERQGAAFIPMGWVCPVCQYMTSDEKERQEEDRLLQAKEIPKLVEMEEPAGTPEACNQCNAWSTCTASIPESTRCKKTRAKMEKDIRNQATLPAPVPTPAQLQKAFSDNGFHVEVVVRDADETREPIEELVRPLMGKRGKVQIVKDPMPPQKFGVKLCREKKCVELQRDPKWPDSPERCQVMNSMPGSMPCCVKEMTPEQLMRLADCKFPGQVWINNQPPPGIKNCPAICPYKVVSETVNDKGRKVKKGLCGFSGRSFDEYGTCGCNVLGNPDQEKQIDKITETIINLRRKPFLACHEVGCPDGVSRCKPGDTSCPAVRIPFNDLKRCPLWRIPEQMLKSV